MRLADGTVLTSAVAASGAVTVVARADRIIVREKHGAHMTEANVINAHVAAVRVMSNGWLIEVDAGKLAALVPRAYATARVLEVGAPVTLEIPVAGVHLIPKRS